MTFLELVNEVRSGVGMQGTGPASVTSATQAEMDIINAVRNAWIDIQNMRTEWLWMRETADFFLTVGQDTYTLPQIFGPSYRFRHWHKKTMYMTINGLKTPVLPIDYDNFIYKTRNDTVAKPSRFYTIRRADNALIFSIPDSNYTVQIDYFKSPQRLVENTDIPEMPEHFHLMIVYAAIEKYSASVISVRSIYDQFSQQYVEMKGQLMREQLEKKKVITRGIA